MIGEDKLIRFSGVKSGEACTIVLRGAGGHVLEEAERSIHDALCVLSQTVKNSGTVFGGGCSEMLMACEVDKLGTQTAGKKALAIKGFAQALRNMPATIADNAGYDSSELVTQLMAAHTAGNVRAGLDMNNACVGDMEELGASPGTQTQHPTLVVLYELVS